jgi:hypothetical protein
MSARPRASWREVALPSEHGGWSLTAEPIVLGLLVAWSGAGLALGGAAMVAFVARTSIKVVLVDRWRDRRLERTALAARIALAEVAVIMALGIVAVVTAGERWFLVPLAVAVPLVAVELWFDMRSRSRRLIPELAGTVGIGAVAAAIVLADGRPAATALGLWVVVAARAGSSIPLVRAQIDRLHDRPSPRWPRDLAQGLALGAVALAWAVGWLPVAPVLALVVVAVFSIVSLRIAVPPVAVLGIQQMAVGLVVVLVAGLAVRLG